MPNHKEEYVIDSQKTLNFEMAAKTQWDSFLSLFFPVLDTVCWYLANFYAFISLSLCCKGKTLGNYTSQPPLKI